MGRLAFILALAVSAASAQPCVVGGKRYDMKPDTCARAGFAESIYKKLLVAAGKDPLSIPLVILDRPDPQFVDYLDSSYGPDLQVRVSFAFLDAFGGDELTLMAVLSHEVGHIIQDDAPGAVDKLEEKFGSKRIEAHADLVGGQLAKRAGYASADYLTGRERKWGCAVIRSKEDEHVESHPTRQDQWVNMMLYQDFVNAMPGFPAVGLDVFDEHGVLKPSRLIGPPNEALDYFIEAAGTRASWVQFCGTPAAYSMGAEGVRNRLARAKAGLPW